MTVLIKDEATDRMIRQLAERTGETITDAVKGAVSEKLARTPLSEKEVAERLRRIEAIIARADAMPTVDHRPADEIVGYNAEGHFD
ncbi:MAG: type II toxin-antitoxin system VapB family antitoxin [Alphaproteobacteria bacterium]|nr:type II toxin-antitoxin system VapB family antitoxin [Alphaproteobacteria bacterium]